MIASKQVEYAKEVDDVLVAVVSLVKEIRSGKSIGEIAAGSLGKVMDAVGGVAEIDDELRDNRTVAMQTIGYRTGELAAAILG